MKVGFIQMTPEFGNVDINLETASSLVNQSHADLLVLPEFFNSGYLFTSQSEVNELAESVETGRTVKTLKHLSRDKDVMIVAGFPERSGHEVFNSCVLVQPSGQVDIYRKTHLFDREKLYFTPGNTGFKVIETPLARIGMMICFDWFFPESTRTLALKGAQIIAHPANLVLPHCPEAMITRSLENRVFTITANRCGSETRDGRTLSYIGRSRIVSCRGQVLATVDQEQYVTRIVDIDPHEASLKAINSRNDLFGDRRIEYYSQDLD